MLIEDIPMYKNFERENQELNRFIEDIEFYYRIKLTEQEVDFITFPINTRNFAYAGLVDNSGNEEVLWEIVTKMISKVRTRFMIHIDEHEFFQKVSYHLIFLINRLIFRMPVKDIFSDQIKIRFPLAFQLAKISMDVLVEQYHLIGTKVDISYLAVYYALVLDEKKNDSLDGNKQPVRYVAVITNSGRGTIELIKRQLQEIIGTHSIIELLSLHELNKKDISKYGLLFSTEDILGDDKLPIIHIGGIIDYDSLSKKINEIEEKQSDIEEISHLVNLNVFAIDAKLNYKESVKEMTEFLIMEGIASTNIYDLFIIKEKMSSMIYENGVAFPHLTDPKIEKINLTLGILRTPTESVKVILLLLIPEHMDEWQEDILMKIYDRIFSFIRDEVLVRRLTTIKKVEDFHSLMKGCN